MIVNFDTASLSPNEAQGLIALLATFCPQPGQIQTISVSSPFFASAVAVAPNRNDADITTPVIVANIKPEPEPAIPGAAAAPEPAIPGAAAAPERAPRSRRTMAEMAAARAGETNPIQAAAPSAAPEAAAASAKITDASPSAGANGAAKITPADELRALLNGYIARHSMEDAIGQLKAFSCNRVTEALALEPVKLSELAAALRG